MNSLWLRGKLQVFSIAAFTNPLNPYASKFFPHGFLIFFLTFLQVLSIAAYTNPLNPDAYPGLRKMEAEVVRFTTDMENYCN